MKQQLSLSPEARGAAFGQFYQQHHAAVIRFLWARVRCWQDAEDLAELTFTKALDSWERCEYPLDNRKPWLIRIAANVAIDHFRAAGVRATTGLASAAQLVSRDDPAREAESAAIRACYQRALASLPARQRAIASLHFDGASGQEIAEVVGMSPGAVKSAVYRIRRHLQDDAALRAWAA